MKTFHSSLLSRIPHTKHAFFSCKGGVSSGVYESLNCGYGSQDAPENIVENRHRVAKFLHIPNDHVITSHQTHSTICVHIDETQLNNDTPIMADAMVTTLKNIALSVLTADCGSILLADTNNPIVAIAHSGWKGTHGGILYNVVKEMQRLGSQTQNIIGCLGPTISQKNYEVDTHFYTHFCSINKKSDIFFMLGKDSSHWQFNLPLYIAHQANEIGIQFEDLNLCTYEHSDLFFSRRRNFHNNITDYGRLISSIKIL